MVAEAAGSLPAGARSSSYMAVDRSMQAAAEAGMPAGPLSNAVNPYPGQPTAARTTAAAVEDIMAVGEAAEPERTGGGSIAHHLRSSNVTAQTRSVPPPAAAALATAPGAMMHCEYFRFSRRFVVAAHAQQTAAAGAAAGGVALAAAAEEAALAAAEQPPPVVAGGAAAVVQWAGPRFDVRPISVGKNHTSLCAVHIGVGFCGWKVAPFT